MLKTLGNTEFTIWSGEGRVEVDGSSRARYNGNKLNKTKIDSIEVENNKVRKKVQKPSKSKKMIRLDFLTPEAKLAFTKLRQAFVKASILHYFDPECSIQIEMDISGYTIGGIFSQLTLDNLN